MTTIPQDDMTGDAPRDERVLRYACSICDALFDLQKDCYVHLEQKHMGNIARTYIRPTYRTK